MKPSLKQSTAFLTIPILLGLGFLILGTNSAISSPDKTSTPAMAATASNMAWKQQAFVKPSESQLKRQLTPLQFSVTQHEDTERPFKNTYWDNKKSGIYVDIVSGEPLFSSTDKFKSGTGWPSFTKPIGDSTLVEKSDRSLFFKRTEIRSKLADSHLGHLFNDGPQPTGLRYCINSASLRFIPTEELANEGYGQFTELFK